MMHFLSAILLVMLFQANACAQKRSLVLDDVYRIKDVSEPDISPDGNWAVYTVHELHKNTNKTSTNLWLISLLTKQTKQITFTKIDTNSLPKWSPDGKWLAFLSDSDDAGTQIRLIAAQSNKEIQLTHFNGSITDYTWSPDSKEIAFVAKANKMGDASDSEAKPIVIDRYQFKDDEQGGYLTDSRSHLYLFNLLTKETNLLTPGSHDEYLPAWSPNGKYIAYVKKRGKDPDRDFRYDIFIISPHKDMSESQLTYYPGNNMDPDFESNLDWNPQSSKIAYLRTKEDKWSYYSPYQLAVVDLNTHQEQLVTSLDKWCAKPQWSADGTAIYALIEESRQTHLNKINLKTGLIQKLTHGLSQDKDFVIGQEKIVLLSTDDLHPPELFLMKFNQELKWGSLTHQNQKLLDEVKFQPAQDFEFNSFDGLKIQGLLMKPFNSVPEKKLPTFLYLHGGPVDQFTHEFDFDLQWLAANGYAVIAPNPRGSSGRGFKFARA
ncbi:MAG: prolyl oligopeptidase family serine peptidase, partial [bacterium]|nr:prolyl oligopeptidase family serine peptidase [bacterium]